MALATFIVVATLAASIPLAFVATTKPAWFLFAFDVIMPVPLVMAFRYARGKWDDPTGLGLGCIAGTVFAGSVLGYLSLPQGVLGTADGPVGAVRMVYWLLARVFAAGLIASSAVRIGLAGDRARWRSFLAGAVMDVVALGLLAALYKFRSSTLLDPREGAMEFARIGSLIAAGLVIFVCLCGGTHFTIRAFEPRSTKQEDPKDPASQSSATPA